MQYEHTIDILYNMKYSLHQTLAVFSFLHFVVRCLPWSNNYINSVFNVRVHLMFANLPNSRNSRTSSASENFMFYSTSQYGLQNITGNDASLINVDESVIDTDFSYEFGINLSASTKMPFYNLYNKTAQNQLTFNKDT